MTQTQLGAHALGQEEPLVPRAWGRARLVLVVLLGALVLLTALTGTRPGTFAELEDRVAQGQVTQVTVRGASPQGGLTDLVWRDPLMQRKAQVRMVVPGVQEGELHGTLPVVEGEIADHLRGLSPHGDVDVRYAEWPTVTGQILTWEVPPWVGLGAFAWALTVVVYFFIGPPPRLATRWAWFWLAVGSGGAAVLFYPVAGMPREGEPLWPEGRRLTGGWTLLLAVLVLAIMV